MNFLFINYSMYLIAFIVITTIFFVIRGVRICKLKRIILTHEHTTNTKDDSLGNTIYATISSIPAREINTDSTIHSVHGDFNHQDMKTVSHFKEYSPAISDALISSVPSIIALNNIDWDVFEAVRHSASTNLDLSKWANLKDYLNEHYFDVGEPTGFLNRFFGYIGEIKAQNFYEQSGHFIEMANSPNQPGYDMHVDGIPINVKVGSPQTISDHFEKYPDIPVVTGPEQAAAFEDNDMVIGLPVLDKIAIKEATENTLDITDNDFDIGGPTIPTITAIMSSYRELMLLTNGHTNINTALKNIGLDIAGTSLGGWAGVKAGALIGSYGGPVGMIIGGLIGGVSGAALGRNLSNEMKNKPFKMAVDNYKRTVAYAESSIQSKGQELRHILSKRIEIEHSRQQHAFKKLNVYLNKDVYKLNEWSRERCQSFIKSFIAIIPEIEASLKNEKRQELVKIIRSQFCIRMLWPSTNDIKYRLVACSYDHKINVFRGNRKYLSKNLGILPEVVLVKTIKDIVTEHPLNHEGFNKICFKLKKNNHTIKSKSHEVLQTAKIIANRINIYSQLEIQKATHESYNQIGELIIEVKACIETAREAVVKEALKIGIDIDKYGEQKHG